MRGDDRPSAATVEAARAGGGPARDQLIADCLPLVYNVVGRALDGQADADADDAVEETLARAAFGLDGLLDTAAFRPWLLALAVQQIRDRWHARQQRPVFAPGPPPGPGLIGSAADFVDLTVLLLGLSGQQAEVAEATRWIEHEDRDVLSLWWLEAVGEVTRAELAAGCGITPQHATVRVQRMKARLGAARTVVRALNAAPRCADLTILTTAWNGRPSPLWRKRIARHTRECPVCEREWSGVLPVEALLDGIGLVPPPAGFSPAPRSQASASR